MADAVGFIGLGIMGRPMAGHLKQAGHALVLSTHHKAPPADLADGATVVDTPAAVAAAAPVVILMLPDTPQVEEVLFGPKGVAEGLKPGSLVIDMSTISPSATRDFAARVAAKGAAYLDAPVSGGQVGAEQATLAIMIGGDPAAVARAQPLFQRMGKTITHVGPNPGDGQACKAVNQVIVALNIQAVAEGLALAERLGLSADTVRAAIGGGFAGSKVLEVHGKRMIDRKFDPGFRVRLHRKDLDIALGEAERTGLALPNAAQTLGFFKEMEAGGQGDRDHSTLFRRLIR